MTNTVLDETYHSRLLANIDQIAKTAGVPVHMIHQSMKEFCSNDEIKWVAGIRQHASHGSAGLCLVGGSNADNRLMAMAAALIRNYIDARVITLTELVTFQEEGTPPFPTVLLVPDFCPEMQSGKTLTNWQVQLVHSLLLDRFTHGKQTLLHVGSLDRLKQNFGEALHEFITSRWTMIHSKKEKVES